MTKTNTNGHKPHVVLTVDGGVVYDSNAGVKAQDSGGNPPAPPPGHP